MSERLSHDDMKELEHRQRHNARVFMGILLIVVGLARMCHGC